MHGLGRGGEKRIERYLARRLLYFWRTVKYEEVYIHEYTSPREARQALTRYFEFYNQERPHQALDYLTPADVYFHTVTAGQRQNE
jgi:putative transposase